MLEAAYHSGKPVIYGGTGNGPAFIERTANIRQAVQDIIASKTFDNGVASAAEQSIVVDSCIANEVRTELEAAGAYFMQEEEADALGRMFYYPDGSANPEMAGKTAKELAKRAGFPWSRKNPGTDFSAEVCVRNKSVFERKTVSGTGLLY